MSTLGVKQGTVRLVKHSEDWHKQFLEEKTRLEAVLAPSFLDIQHIGSSAVPGLDAKPILDIGIAVSSYNSIECVTAALGKISYIQRGHLSVQMGHIYQRLQGADVVTHIVHVLEHTNPHYQDYLYMRDYLTVNASARQTYQQLKQSLAATYPNERRKYTGGKRDIIGQLLAEARNTQTEHKG